MSERGAIPFRVKEIATFLEHRCGLMFGENDLPRLWEKLADRAREIGVASLDEYHLRLTGSRQGDDELKALLNAVTINETYFFRIPAHFRLLEKEILPVMTDDRRSRRRLRIWSAGCSSGEEVYSLAICVLEHNLTAAWDVRVIGTDISDQVIERARKGIYRGRTMKTVPPMLLEKYFRPTHDGYAVNDALREICDFRLHNLVLDPPPERDLDVVFFRNVMIYFQTNTCRRILEKVAGSLQSDGCLFIGAAETLWQISDRFYPHYHGDCFVYRQQPAVDEEPPATSAIQRPPDSPPATPEIGKRSEEIRPAAPLPPTRPRTGAGGAEAERVSMAREFMMGGGYPEALKILSALTETGDVIFLRSLAYASMGDEPRFMRAKDRLLELDPLHLEVRYLAAVMQSGQGRLNEAMDEVRKILFVDEYLVLPRYMLMLWLERAGRMDQARQECRNLIRIIRGGRSREFGQSLLGREVTNEEIMIHCNGIIQRGA